ncbi:MAG: prepilin-type N-terminal cleavage/methylation domain-containing protein, partial [Verrucomicrobiota bacterium]
MKIQIHPLQKQAVRTRGLTLIELVVVLAVLVALVGMVLAFFPDIVRKASASTSANTAKDIGRTLQIKFTTQQTYGDGYDNFADSTSSIEPALVGFSNNVNGLLIAKPTQPDVNAFAAVGITQVQSLSNNTNTFNLVRTPLPLGTGVDVLTLQPSSAAILSMDPNATNVTTKTYYLFGLGAGSTAVGPGGFQDAPVRAGE